MKDSSLWRAASDLPKSIGVILFGFALSLTGVAGAGQLTLHEDVGSPAPAFTLKAVNGKPHRLDDYRGKVVLVNFWGTWCPPCLAELPSMQRLADLMAAEAFEILAINVGESPFRVSKFVKLLGVNLTALLDDKGEVFQAWGGTVYPTSFVLDGKGQIRYVAYGPLEWDSEDVVATLRDLLPLPRAADD